MDCREAKNYFVDILSGEIAEKERKRLSSHLAMCTACSQEKETLEKAWRVIGNAPEVEVPEDLHQVTISRMQAMLKAAQPSGLWSIPLELWIPKPLASVMAGMAMAFFSLWVLRGVTEFERLSAQVIFHGAALMTGLLIGAFLIAMDSLALVHPSWRWASRTGLVSLGLTMLGTLLCPKMSLIEWWEMLPPGKFLLSFGPAISHSTFGLIYAFIPFFIAVLILSKKVKGELLRQTLIAGAFFLLLIMPAIYLQAWPLSVNVFLSWAAGSVLGAFIGGLSGASLYRLGFWRFAAGT